MQFDQVMQRYLKGESTEDEKEWLLDMALKAINSIGSVSTSFHIANALPKFPTEATPYDMDAQLISIVDDEYGAIISLRVSCVDAKKLSIGRKIMVLREKKVEGW